jgi:UDP-N-acetylmuramate dehydrogenase
VPITLIQHNVPLAPMTSWHVGGMAEYFAQPSHLKLLSALIADRPDLPITWLGLGSNVLVRDNGIQGLVICTRGLSHIELQDPSHVSVEAGIACAKLARFCQKHSLGGGEFFVGIPGTIGGALAMNAGAFGGSTWDRVHSVTVVDDAGELSEKIPADFEIGYRYVKPKFSNFLGFVSARFHFGSKLSAEGKEDIRLLLQQRQATQPIGTFNCGSVYRNPIGDHAARLIETCGFKGKSVGGAVVSPKHANFILNSGKATAKEIEQLMAEIEEAVWARFQIKLEREVRILGESV